MNYLLNNFILNKKSENSNYNHEKLQNDLTTIAPETVFKTDNNVMLISTQISDIQGEHQDLIQSLRSCVIDKTTLNILSSQFNHMIYNNDALKYIQDINWEQIEFQNCIEGTTITVFHHEKWYMTTKNCLDANLSKWSEKSYSELFDELRDFDFDELNKDYFYLFILVHHKNKNIVTYEKTDDKLILCGVYEKTTQKEIKDYSHLDNYKLKNENLEFKNQHQVMEYLNNITQQDIQKHQITNEGLIMRVYNLERSSFIILKLQTFIYAELAKIKPNTSNVYCLLLELYQHNNLNYALYFTKDIQTIKKINSYFKTLTSEILRLYYLTRKHRNSELYESFNSSYKTVLFNLHKIYLDTKTPIKIHNVYQYLKNINSHILMNLFKDYHNLNIESHDINIIEYGKLL